jgi:hypothetical protein
MFNLDEVLRMLKLAIGRLERAPVGLTDVPVVQAARADLERVLEGLSGCNSAHVDNPAAALRAVAKSLQPLSNPDVHAAWVDTVEAAIMVEATTRAGPV